MVNFAKNIDLNKISNRIDKREYIELEYLAQSDYDKTKNSYIIDYNLNKSADFTWYQKVYSKNVISDLNKYLGANFDTDLSKKIDISKYDIFISYGRKLKKLYFDNFKIYNQYRLVVPVFEKEYYGDKIFLYKSNKKYNIIDNDYWTNELWDFNVDGNIRYEEETSSK